MTPTTKRLGLLSHLVFWAFLAEWFLSLTGAWTDVVVLTLFVAWVVLRTAWYQRMRREGAIGVSRSEAMLAFVFVVCAVLLLAIPLGAPLAGFATPLKVIAALSALYVIGRGVVRGITDARTSVEDDS